MMLVAWPVEQFFARLLTGSNSVPGVVLGALVEGDGQDDADQAGPGGPHVEPGRMPKLAHDRQVSARDA